MDEKDKKLMEKFDEIMANKPLNAEALDFWSKLGEEEYKRLIYLFENNMIENMSDEIKMELIGVFKTLKERLYKKD